MFNWKVEEMKLLDMDRVDEGYDKAFACESEVSIEDKFEFVDRMQDGKLSYLVGMVKAYQEAIPSMKKGDNGKPTDYAKKAWVRENDTQNIFCRRTDSYGDYGDFDILHICGNLFTFPNRTNYYRQITEEEFIGLLFHKQLEECEKKEHSYYFSQDKMAQFLNDFRHKYYGSRIEAKENCSLIIHPATEPTDKNSVVLYTYEPEVRGHHKKELSLEEVHQIDAALSELAMKKDEMQAAIEQAEQVYEKARQSVLDKIKSMAG